VAGDNSQFPHDQPESGPTGTGGAPSEADLLRWSQALAGIARTGLGFSENPYERERFEEILAVAADIRHAADSSFDPDALVHEWMASVGEGVAGYQTPKVAVGAVVGNDDGEVLLIKRADSGIWLYPTGWADIGYSASEVAVKEVEEETGIECEVVQLLAVLDGMRMGLTRIPLYSLVFHCRAIGGEISPHPLECLDAGWFARDALPEPLASYDLWGDLAFAAIDGSPVAVRYDLPRTPPWRVSDV
jgi:ADP-ribose pyrophosphatase YjhB (NUDIX family)